MKLSALFLMIGIFFMSSPLSAATDSYGNTKIIDAQRDRDAILQQTTILQQIVVQGEYDSSTVISTRGWNNVSLMFYPTFYDTSSSANRVDKCVLGIQMRGSLVPAQDSLSAYTIIGRNPITPAAAGAPDTLGSLQNCAPVSTAISSREVPLILPLNTGYPRGTMVKMSDLHTGDTWTAPFTSFRFHPVFLNSSGAVCTVQRMQLRVDVVGWR